MNAAWYEGVSERVIDCKEQISDVLQASHAFQDSSNSSCFSRGRILVLIICELYRGCDRS